MANSTYRNVKRVAALATTIILVVAVNLAISQAAVSSSSIAGKQGLSSQRTVNPNLPSSPKPRTVNPNVPSSPKPRTVNPNLPSSPKP
jgi:hypothetical protein